MEVDRGRGRCSPQIMMLAFIGPEERVPVTRPLQAVKRLADEVVTDEHVAVDETLIG